MDFETQIWEKLKVAGLEAVEAVVSFKSKILLVLKYRSSTPLPKYWWNTQLHALSCKTMQKKKGNACIKFTNNHSTVSTQGQNSLKLFSKTSWRMPRKNT